MTRIVGLLALLASLATGGVAHATTFYTATTGSDGRSCATAQTIGTPKQTINSAVGCLGPGDTLLVRGGTYNEGLMDAVPSGTSGAYVHVAAYPGETVWLVPGTTAQFAILFSQHQAYIEFDGINIRSSTGVPGYGGTVKMGSYADSGSDPHHMRWKNAEVIVGSDGIPNQGTGSAHVGFLISANYPGTIGHNEFLNLTVHGGGDAGDFATAFYIETSDNIVDGCNMYDGVGWQLQSWNDYGYAPNNNIFRNNVVHDMTRTPDGREMGIVSGSGSTNSKIYNNVVYGMGGSATGAGIYVYNGDSPEVYNNTVYGGNLEGIIIEVNTTNARVRNNISYGNARGNYRDSGIGTIASNNLFLGENPLFVNAGGANVQVSGGSPAVDRGATLSLVTSDIRGFARPQGGAYDIGAYESGSAVIAPPAAPIHLHLVQ